MLRGPGQRATAFSRALLAVAALAAFVLAGELVAATAGRARLEGSLPMRLLKVIDQRLSSHPMPNVLVSKIPTYAVPGGKLIAATGAIPVMAPAQAIPLQTAQPAARLSTKAAGPKRKEDRVVMGSLSYTALTDFAKPTPQRTFTHTVAAGATYHLKAAGKEIVDLGLSVSGQMTTVDNQLDGSQRQLVELADVDLSASRSWELGNAIGADHSFNPELSHNLPTSEDSRYQGVKGISTIGLGTSSKFFAGLLSVSHTPSYTYLFNTYSHSPVSNKVNREYTISDGLSLRIRIFEWLRFTVGGNIAWQKYHDGTMTQSFGNSFGLSSTIREYSVSLKTTNGSHPENASTYQMMYYDEYRRRTSLTVSRSF